MADRIGVTFRRTVLSLALAVAAAVLASCGASNGEAAEPSACGAVRSMFLHPAATAWWSGGEPSAEAVDQDLRVAATIAAGSDRAGIQRLRQLVSTYGLDPIQATPDERQELVTTWTKLVGWAADRCPPGFEPWACSYDALVTTYERDDQGVVESGEVTTTTLVPTTIPPSVDPLATAATIGGRKGLVLLSRDDRRAMAGWKDEQGLVGRRVELLARDGRWFHKSTTHCSDRPAGS